MSIKSWLDHRNDVRLAVTYGLLTHAVRSPVTSVATLIATVAFEANVADEWAAEVFWELVRLKFLSPRGAPGPYLAGTDPDGWDDQALKRVTDALAVEVVRQGKGFFSDSSLFLVNLQEGTIRLVPDGPEVHAKTQDGSDAGPYLPDYLAELRGASTDL